MCKCEWKNAMRNIDLTMSPTSTRVICTDFGATLSLNAAELDNCSVAHHSVVDIFLVNSNFRKVKLKNKKKEEDVVMVSDCERWVFFGDTISKGKKNDHVFHNSCLTYLIQYYDNIEYQPTNIVWTDNCPTQYKCRQNFFKIASASKSINKHSIIIHKFAGKYRFKGSWDATGKLIKNSIQNLELKLDRCDNAFACYIKLRKDLTRSGEEKDISKLLQYEQSNNEGILKNTTFTTRKTHIGYATENKDEYDVLKNDTNFNHIVFTDRQNIADMKAVKDTLKISQLQGQAQPIADGKWLLTTSFLPCSCPNCRAEPMQQTINCNYKNDQNIKQITVQEKGQFEKNNPANRHGLLYLKKMN